MASETAWSFDAVRDTRSRLYPALASCEANSLPMPSLAPVMRAQEPRGPKLRS